MLFADRPRDIDRLREAFAAAGFTARGVLDILGPEAFALLKRDEVGPALRRTASREPLDTLIRLFVCAAPVPRQDAARAIDVDAGLDTGVLRADADAVTSQVQLGPVLHDTHEFLVPSDVAPAGSRRPDFVNGVGPASMTLAGLTIRHPVERCLDLGTGSGVQALLASTHATEVVATDRNPRAVAFAAVASRLNGVDTIDVREGDLFDPVAGERFDLVVSNPPFVISPSAEFVYRDSGLVGDEVCRRIVGSAPEHLADGGWGQVLANWAHIRGEDWQDHVAAWIQDLDCDAWIVQSHVEDAATYASNWIRHDYAEHDRAAAFSQWMAHYESIGLEAVGFGLVTLRKASRETKWMRVEELARDFALPCGDDVAAAFDRGVWLQQRDDRTLLDSVLVVNPHVELRQTRYAADGEWYPDQSILEITNGLRYAAAVDAVGADLVAGCDGATPLGTLVQRLADAIGLEVADITPHSVGIVRKLVQEGFVRPVG